MNTKENDEEKKTEKGRLIEDNGKRLDGRNLDELRKIQMKVGVLNRAAGSAYVEWGKNKILVGVYGPREAQPRHIQNPLKGIIQATYNMASFSVSDRKRPGPDRRSTEISKIISRALEAAILSESFPRATIDIYLEVLEADAGTRCASLTAASLALADAGIPMKDMVVSCAAGKVDGRVVLDLMKEEDNYGQADLPIAILPKSGEIVLMQLDGHLTREEFEKATSLAMDGCKKVYELQKEALMKSLERVI
jgi:ribosomal RNA-processing protein RRP41/SKI6 (EC 3.1.13.-)